MTSLMASRLGSHVANTAVSTFGPKAALALKSDANYNPNPAPFVTKESQVEISNTEQSSLKHRPS